MEAFVKTYAELKKWKPAGIRGVIRHQALNVLSLLGKLRSDSTVFSRPRVQFLYLHHVFQDELQPLTELVKWLANQHTFVSYSEAVALSISGKIDKPYISFSFDDGMKNNLPGANLLADMGVSACFFINPGVIGEKNPGVLEKHCKEQLNFPPVEFLDWTEVENMQKSGHEFGSHTMFHTNLGLASKDFMEEDFSRSREVILEKCGTCTHFAFPYGRFVNFNEEARKLIFEAGYTSCASAERGAHLPHPDNFSPGNICIRRDHVILDWPLAHLQYFMDQSARNANLSQYDFPY